jgi:gliding motility-associatede transport system auxiliary component
MQLNNWLFVVLLLAIVGLLAWVSTRYNYQADWTANARRSLAESSVKLLEQAKGPLTITAFARDNRQMRGHISDVIGRYQRYKHDIVFTFVNPDTDPARAQAMGVNSDGEVVIEYGGRKEFIQSFDLNEQNITNALQRLMRSGEHWLVFLDGHGERRPHGEANKDLSLWVKQLEDKGFKARSLNLAENAAIPDNIAALVISAPQVDLLPGEVKAVDDYVSRGGNLLWLGDPGPLHGLEPLAKQLGVQFLKGIVVDLTTQLLGIQSAAIAAVTSYSPSTPVTKDFNLLTVFPLAAGLTVTAPPGWQSQTMLRTGANSWVETGDISSGKVSFSEKEDIRGPVTIGISLTRDRASKSAKGGKEPAPKQQRVIVIGDGDFLSNQYVGNVGNLDLGINMVNWLSADEHFLDIPAKTAPDTDLRLSRLQSGIIGFGFWIGVPVMLLAGGLAIWLRRRKR